METQLGTRWTFPAHLWKACEQQSVILGLLFLFQIQKANPGIWSAPERRWKNFAERQTVSSTRLCARGEAEADRGVCGWPGPPGPSTPSHSVGAHPTINKITLHTLPWGHLLLQNACMSQFSGFLHVCALVKLLQNHLTNRRRSIREQLLNREHFGNIYAFLCVAWLTYILKYRLSLVNLKSWS